MEDASSTLPEGVAKPVPRDFRKAGGERTITSEERNSSQVLPDGSSR